jgi:type I restriction enzyme R subunit
MQDARKKVFQQDIINHLVCHSKMSLPHRENDGTSLPLVESNGWKLGESAAYDQKYAIYTEDLVGYLSETQPEQWDKFFKMHPKGAEEAFVKSVARQLDKKGTLHVLRQPIKDRGAKFRLCQFKPDHDLNPEMMERYAANRLTVVPELSYSPNDYTGLSALPVSMS